MFNNINPFSFFHLFAVFAMAMERPGEFWEGLAQQMAIVLPSL